MNLSKMTPDFAERILTRQKKKRPEFSEARIIAILTDWLEEMTYREIVAKHKISKHQACVIVSAAKKQAREVLGEAQDELKEKR